MEGGRSARFGRYSRRDLLDIVRNQEPHFRQWRRERNPQSRRFSSARKGATDPSSVALERAAPGGAVRRASTRVPRAARRESNGGADVGRDAAAMWGGRDVRGRARRSEWTPRAVCLALTLLLAFVPATDGARFVGKVHEPVAWKFLAKCVRVAVAPRASLPEPKAPAVARPRRRASGRLAQKDVATRRVERARWLTRLPAPPTPTRPHPSAAGSASSRRTTASSRRSTAWSRRRSSSRCATPARVGRDPDDGTRATVVSAAFSPFSRIERPNCVATECGRTICPLTICPLTRARFGTVAKSLSAVVFR